MRKHVAVCALLLLSAGLVVLSRQPVQSADPPGRTIQPFRLSDPRDRSATDFADLKDKKAIVVVFLGTECPVNNAFLPVLAELHRTYAPRGVQFLAINSNQQDTPERVAAHAKQYKIPFPVLKDPGNVVADNFKATR